MKNKNAMAILVSGILAATAATNVYAAPFGASPGGAPGGGSSTVSWSGAAEITGALKAKGKTYRSTSADENAVLIDTSGKVVLTAPTVKKSGGTSASDAYSFYGTNSASLEKNKVYVRGGMNH